jgi:hypothetical protein
MSEKEQVIVNMGYDPEQDTYGLMFKFQGQVEFAIPMTPDQLDQHIQKLLDLYRWGTDLKKEKECNLTLN